MFIGHKNCENCPDCLALLRKQWLEDMSRKESDVMTDEDGAEYIMLIEEDDSKHKAYLPDNLQGVADNSPVIHTSCGEYGTIKQRS